VKQFFLVLSAPSGGGKTTIAKMLLQGREDLGYSVSATTRTKRPGERDGVDYYFLSRDEFASRQQQGEFLEWATYGGELYGTLKSEIERIFSSGRHAVLDVEIEGARQIRRNFSNSLLLFVLPPSAEALVERLVGRNTEDPALVRERIIRAADELTAVAEYDYAILNEDLVVAVAQVAAILEAESWRVSRQDTLPDFIEQLRGDVVRAAEKIGKRSRVARHELGSRDTSRESRDLDET
jgi:guanylate kinase